MALTGLQRAICRLLADNRVASGESYVAGGVALNEVLAAARISELQRALAGGRIVFQRGRIRGAWPQLKA